MEVVKGGIISHMNVRPCLPLCPLCPCILFHNPSKLFYMVSSCTSTLPSSDQILFASSLDNARKCFLVLKYVFFPLLSLSGIALLIVQALSFFGYTMNSPVSFFMLNAIIAIIIGAPVVIVPAIVELRYIPASVRLAAVHSLFAFVCVCAPVFTAHCVWQRRYQEVTGFLLIHDFFPSAPAIMSSAGSEKMSVCDDEQFFVTFTYDHAVMSTSPFFLPMMIELPSTYFTVIFSFNTILFWSSAFRVINVSINTCINHPEHGPAAEFAKQSLPLCHMMNLVTCVSYLFTRLFVVSRNREQNKQCVKSAIEKIITISSVHLRAIFHLSSAPVSQPSAAFRSRTDFFSKKEQPISTLLLPANLGIAFKVSAGLKDWGLYVWALGLPIYFCVFEFMRMFFGVHLVVRGVMDAFFSKYVMFLIGIIAPHYIIDKAIHQGRVRAAWLVTSCCFGVIFLCIRFILPGSTRILPRNFRFFPFFVMSNVAPPTILRAISQVASAQFIIATFLALHM